tara:strand:+ start:341 stop:523 length:183 start_codon:yes stop_codon:yes gene_type:complete
MKVTGIMEVELVSVLKRKLEKVRDDIEWADPDDPRIEGLINEINYYKQKEEEGILYEPNF